MTCPRSPIALLALLAALLGVTSSASAEATRPSLPASVGGAHVLIHYDPATASTGYAQAGLADFEEAYSRLVAGAGGTPNAGLRAPVGDGSRGGDGRTDVYLTTPPGHPTFVGGQAVEDGATYPDPLIDSGFLYMTPSLARTAFRFRAAHELMHAIQDAYVVTSGLFTESTANWAADAALPDIEPGDSQFTVPFLPLDCSYGDWGTRPCGNGYRQWLFFEMLTERYGLGFIHRLWMRHRADCPCQGTTSSIDRTILDHAITDEPGDATLATAYADYAALLWDPTRWTTTAVDKLHREDGPPATTDLGLSRDATASGARTATVDHLATRYVRLAQDGASAPGDQLHVAVSSSAAATPRLLSGTGPGRARTITTMTPVGGGDYEATVSLDAANVTDVVLPLINDRTTDAMPFTWHAELLPAGPPAGPGNDLRASPLRIQPRTTTALDIAYAGGRGSDEANDCATTRTAGHGVWFIVLVDKGTLTFDPRGSDFDAATAVYDVSIPGQATLWSCSQPGDRGYISGDTFAREYLVYVGRDASSAGTGHALRLAVDGVPNTFGTETTDLAPPIVLNLAIAPSRFRAARSGDPISTNLSGKGAQLSFTLTEAATGQFAFQRATTGRTVRGRCVKTTSRNRAKRRCTRYVAAGGAERRGLAAGQVRLRLTGRRTARKALTPGAYRLHLTATDAAGNASAAATAPFTIKR